MDWVGPTPILAYIREMKKKAAARLILFIHLGFAILAVVRLVGARHQLLKGPFIPSAERMAFENYFLTIAVATWVALVISFVFYCFSKFSAVMAISFLSMLYYFSG
jgi:uncharacterized membrane protein